VYPKDAGADTQYTFSTAVADHMFRGYDGVLKVEGDVGSKKLYDPRSYGKAAETAMVPRVALACRRLPSAGMSLNGVVPCTSVRHTSLLRTECLNRPEPLRPGGPARVLGQTGPECRGRRRPDHKI